jgi:hypothetical protein
MAQGIAKVSVRSGLSPNGLDHRRVVRIAHSLHGGPILVAPGRHTGSPWPRRPGVTTQSPRSERQASPINAPKTMTPRPACPADVMA